MAGIRELAPFPWLSIDALSLLLLNGRMVHGATLVAARGASIRCSSGHGAGQRRSTAQHGLDPMMGGGDVSDRTGQRARKVPAASAPRRVAGSGLSARDQLVVRVQEGQAAIPRADHS